jgi:5-methylcytosine-specific restriction endonuclease McrA
MNACKAFIKYKKKDFDFIRLVGEKSIARSRSINEKTRLRILKRDLYECVKCGRSPATHIRISLHVDHKKPFSKGGSNNIENLQTLCNKCNLGKGAEANL